MTIRGHLARIAALFLMTGLVGGCGAKVVAGNAEPGEDSGRNDAGIGALEDSGMGTVDGGAPDTAITTADGDGAITTADGDSAISPVDGGRCVAIDVAPSDLSCGSDRDCTIVRSGEVCSGQCSCGNTPVNAGAAARVQSETASLTLVACPCAYPGEPRCLCGQCTRWLGPDQPAGCDDAGTTAVEDSGTGIVDGGGPETAISTADGGRCVDIELSTYDQSCTQTSDCVLIQTGEVCSGQCACGGEPVNISEKPRYQQATSGIGFGTCSCPLEFAPICFEKRCILPVVLTP